MFNKIELFIIIEIEECADGTFDVVLKKSSVTHVLGKMTPVSQPREFRRNKFKTRIEAEEDAQRKSILFEKDRK